MNKKKNKNPNKGLIRKKLCKINTTKKGFWFLLRH